MNHLKKLLMLAAAGLCLAAGSAAEPPAGGILVVYYSWSGNTRVVAERVARSLGADIHEIRTVKTYPKDGYETSDEATRELESGRLPELAGAPPDLSRYGAVIIGAPVWNARLPTPVAAFLRQTDLSGKRVWSFSTSMGSGIAGFREDLKKLARNPIAIGGHIDVRFPGNYSPGAFGEGELDGKLADWIRAIREASRVPLKTEPKPPQMEMTIPPAE